ncbi:hypothetical protein [Spiroplasma culicicola]|uniref:Uncharacterized protein n=1 Tax=Spiroplasma culicicola AES-1 TaxID=1276246 RepID=W6AGV7_9MOLU|nr:hypothetical protein [Spiroplasma culicicola]AHI52924.1 hypothetical protein SCULI_v1c05830 [Spiroplasma culicicola AES-1]
MGYYYRHEFKFSTHAIQRIKQRLNLGDEKDEFKLKEIVLDLIEKSTEMFETSKNIYIHTKKANLYFVITKPDKVIVTATPISAIKQLSLIENE